MVSRPNEKKNLLAKNRAALSVVSAECASNHNCMRSKSMECLAFCVTLIGRCRFGLSEIYFQQKQTNYQQCCLTQSTLQNTIDKNVLSLSPGSH